ncbi:hypothetical protein [Pseudonocardia alaniniphila]|uniref:Sulfofructosephosphate aldolase n=1 Tax=Pseudonocardia alaniniphila TaxID=75291 RepID=A0ABS9TU26_9PSEU|nr:hypothetical protein [Pseudonocardia alaniniphila]MCH6172064.1 hypothetical protein [Pseudonocardia alaniniphila]
MTADSTTGPSLDPLTDRRGGFSMVALDQRESLRAMMAPVMSGPVGDESLVEFKTLATAILSPRASAVLLDRAYGLPAAAARAPGCGLVLAADVLQQEPGGPVVGATLDEGVTAELAAQLRPDALKMLVPWTPATRSGAVDLAERFMRLCRTLGLPGIVEGVVRPPDISSWSDADRDAAIVRAAEDLAVVGPTLYKAEVPGYGASPAEAITATARRITEVLDCPWVVLSSGVAAERFAAAVQACRQGGASGFLAGRAVWADAVTAPDPAEFLRTESLRRLDALDAVGVSTP